MFIYNKPHVIPQQDGPTSSGGNLNTEPSSDSYSTHQQHPISVGAGPGAGVGAGIGHPLPSPLPSSSSPTPAASGPGAGAGAATVLPPPSSLLPPPLHHRPRPQAPPSASSIASAPAKLFLGRSSNPRRSSVPLSFPPLFSGPANTSSTSLAASTAEGKPIPFDNGTAAHRTTALRVLNRAYPSQLKRIPSTKSTGASSTTYSQPVLVRTYSGPSHSQSPYNATSHRYRPPSSSRADSRRVPLPSFSRAGSNVSGRSGKPSPIVTRGGNSSLRDGIGSHGSVTNMPRQKATKNGGKLTLSLPWKWASSSSNQEPLQDDLTSLPPIEAFSFKNMLNAEDASHGSIGSDLDRIAEILERSKYSLSNQYEVHVAPHGSGASFVSDVASTHGPRSRRRKGHGHSNSVGSGPTLQAISSDDERRRRRGGGRRRSVAYGTLETIMSSSGSSGEAKSSKKKPAAEIAAEVRGRATAKKGPNTSPGSGSGSGSGSNAANCSSGTLEAGQATQAPRDESENTKLARKKSTSFATAVISSHSVHKDPTSPRSSAAALLSEPSLPRTSNSHIEIQTAEPYADSASNSSGSRSPKARERHDLHFLSKSEPQLEEFPKIPNSPTSGGLLSSLSSWVPWRAPNGTDPLSPTARRSSSHAEGSLRQLLKTTEPPAVDKGKAVAVDPER